MGRTRLMPRHMVIVVVVACLGCVEADPIRSVGDDWSGWPPIDEPGFQRLSVWPGALELDVTFALNDRIHKFGASASALNVGAIPLTGSTSPNHWIYKAFRTSDRTGEPLWTGWTFNARGFGIFVDLEPGKTQDLSGGILEFPVDSLPPGTYYFTASLAFREPAIRTPFYDAGEFEITH